MNIEDEWAEAFRDDPAIAYAHIDPDTAMSVADGQDPVSYNVSYVGESEIDFVVEETPEPYRKPDDEKVAATVQRILDADSMFELNYKLKRIASLLATNEYLGEE